MKLDTSFSLLNNYKVPTIIISVISLVFMIFHANDAFFGIKGWNEGHYSYSATSLFSASNPIAIQMWNNNGILFWVPPMFIWSLFLVFYFFGIGELQARLFIIFLSFITLIFVFLIGKKLFNEKIGYLSVLLVVSDPLFLIYGRNVQTDALMMLFVLAAIYFYLFVPDTNETPNKRIFYYILSLLFSSLALFTKQPGGMVILFVIIYEFFSYIENNSKKVKLILSRVVLYVIITIIPLISWALLGYIYYQPDFVKYFIDQGGTYVRNQDFLGFIFNQQTLSSTSFILAFVGLVAVLSFRSNLLNTLKNSPKEKLRIIYIGLGLTVISFVFALFFNPSPLNPPFYVKFLPYGTMFSRTIVTLGVFLPIMVISICILVFILLYKQQFVEFVRTKKNEAIIYFLIYLTFVFALAFHPSNHVYYFFPLMFFLGIGCAMILINNGPKDNETFLLKSYLLFAFCFFCIYFVTIFSIKFLLITDGIMFIFVGFILLIFYFGLKRNNLFILKVEKKLEKLVKSRNQKEILFIISIVVLSSFVSTVPYMIGSKYDYNYYRDSSQIIAKNNIDVVVLPVIPDPSIYFYFSHFHLFYLIDNLSLSQVSSIPHFVVLAAYANATRMSNLLQQFNYPISQEIVVNRTFSLLGINLIFQHELILFFINKN